MNNLNLTPKEAAARLRVSPGTLSGTSSVAVTQVRPAALDERSIKLAEPGAVLRDGKISGLHMRVFPESKAFYLYYRTKAGVQRRPKLGDYGSITLAQARKLAQDLLVHVAAGHDPSQRRAEARAEATMDELWAEYWKRHGSKKKSGGYDEYNYARFIQPVFGKHKLSAIDYTAMADAFDDWTERGPTQANRILALCAKMFSFAQAPLRWTTENPCRGIVRNKETKRRRKATRAEIESLVARLRTELEGRSKDSAAFIWLLMTTGARRGEIAAARWENVEGQRLLLDEHKTDDGGYARIIYLPQIAQDVLALLPKTNGTLTGVKSPKKFWDRVRKEAGCPDLRLHDLRRTFASLALSTGRISLEGVMQLLGHKSAQTSKVYAWLMEDAASEAVRATADQIFTPAKAIA